MSNLLYMGGRLRLVEEKLQPKAVRTNVIDFPLMERLAKTCGICGRPYSAFEEVCPDCGPEEKEGGK